MSVRVVLEFDTEATPGDVFERVQKSIERAGLLNDCILDGGNAWTPSVLVLACQTCSGPANACDCL